MYNLPLKGGLHNEEKITCTFNDNDYEYFFISLWSK